MLRCGAGSGRPAPALHATPGAVGLGPAHLDVGLEQIGVGLSGVNPLLEQVLIVRVRSPACGMGGGRGPMEVRPTWPRSGASRATPPAPLDRHACRDSPGVRGGTLLASLTHSPPPPSPLPPHAPHAAPPDAPMVTRVPVTSPVCGLTEEGKSPRYLARAGPSAACTRRIRSSNTGLPAHGRRRRPGCSQGGLSDAREGVCVGGGKEGGQCSAEHLQAACPRARGHGATPPSPLPAHQSIETRACAPGTACPRLPARSWGFPGAPPHPPWPG